MSDSRRTLAYSPALDGVRALAVICVMLYHGGTSVMGGGFLGVDIFFVLSGFLITSLLLLEFEQKARIDLLAFWGRRARRLLPALFLVLVAVALYAALLSGEAASAVRKDAAATLFYVSNWWFIVSGNSYFEQFQDPSPLTHTWSLAIEEQWYFVLPLVMVLLLPRLRSRKVIGLGLFALALLSAVEMAWLAPDGGDPSRVYYGTDTRLQSLLVGAALATLLTPGVVDRLRLPVRWLGPLSLAVVVALMLVMTENSPVLYRGGFLLLAFAAALLITSVQVHPDGSVARGLSLRPVVWVGKVSYGLYLWHWPVYVALSPARTGLTGVGLLALRLSVTFAIAAASFYLVEQPIRTGSLSRLTSGQRLALLIGAPSVVLGLLGVTAASARPPAPDSLEAIRDSASRAPAASATSAPATPGASATAVTEVHAVLVGDSVPLSLFAAYQPGSVQGLTVTPGVQFGCGVVPFEAALNGARMPMPHECRIWEEVRADQIAASGANLGVLFAGPWELYDRWIDGRTVPYTDPAWKEATVRDYLRVLEEIADATTRQALVLSSCHGAPEVDLPAVTLYQAGRYPGVVNDPARIRAVNEAAREAVARSGLNVTIIDPGPVLCAADKYRAEIDGVTMHTDGLHFTEAGARWYWKWLGPKLVHAGR